MTRTLKQHKEWVREQASKLMYANSYPTIAIAELLGTTIKQIEDYLGNERRIYRLK